MKVIIFYTKILLKKTINQEYLKSIKNKKLTTIIINHIEIKKHNKDKEELLQREILINSISELVFLLDINLRINYINKAALNTLNTNEINALREHCYKLIFNFDEPCTNCPAIEIIKKTSKSKIIQKKFKDKIWSISFTPYFDQKGNLIGVVKIANDITDQVNLNRKLKHERTQILNIFNGIEEPIYISDPHTYKILFVNKYLKKLIKKDPTGGVCYKEFQGFDKPCDFCTNDIILSNKYKTYQWEYHNPLINRDYLIFDRIIKWPDGRDVRFELAIDITERKDFEKAYSESEEKYKTLFNNIGDAVIITNFNKKIIEVNEKACEFLGYTREEFLNMNIDNIVHGNHKEAFKNNNESIIEIELRKKDGSVIPTEIVTATFKYKNNQRVILSIIRDSSQRKNLERQLLQSQKMEAIGRLAGGIAHDFNNLLTAILGYSELILERKNLNKPLYDYVNEIRNAGKRGENLIQQLLAFSRKQVFKTRIVNLNNLINSLENMLRRIIGEDIELRILLDPNIGNIKVDPSQIEQIIINLIVNARDAMPNGGILTLETGSKYFDEEYCKQHIGTKIGKYTLLCISDTGVGMDNETKKHIFEPFFTTKARDKGTGLGLSTVYGIVKQSGGYIWVYSEKGKGTTFKIYFPAIDHQEKRIINNYKGKISKTGGETILVIDDDESVRKIICEILKHHGYRIIEIKDIKNSLKIIENLKERKFDLLLTDVVMPKVKIKELVNQVKKRYPSIKIVFISGYSEDIVAHHGVFKEKVSLLPKPFSAYDLIKKIENILGEKME